MSDKQSSTAPDSHGHNHHHARSRKEIAALSLGALGVVYGDIGTSPLYAMKECFSSVHNQHRADGAIAADVFGVVSLVFWSLLIIVCVKYLAVVLRADNDGQGGTLSLAALVRQKLKDVHGKLAVPMLLALFGTGMLYGEGMITPAISVLSALEGLKEQNASFERFIVPLAIIILVGLFWVQRYGTGRIGFIFGWVMLLWFLAIGLIAIPAVAGHPEIFGALLPHHGVRFLATHHLHGALLMGYVVLCVTGCEALYADMGHFHRTPIRIAWFAIVFPGLILNYLGQGALYLEHGAYLAYTPNPDRAGEFLITEYNPFFALADGPLLIPMVALATIAAIIASQALISGAFSLTNQAVQLGFFPRVTVIHTSEKYKDQIYIPEINSFFMIGCVALVLAFKNSSNLAAAYGIAVTGLFLITTYLTFLVARRTWGWSLGAAVALFVPLALIELAFFSSNIIKIAAGGWLPLAVGTGFFILMTTWWRGRFLLSQMMETATLDEEMFLDDPETRRAQRVSGTAVFMASGTRGIPNVLLHHFKHNKVFHDQVVLLSIVTENIPFAIGNTAITVRDMGRGFYRVVARVGFMQQPKVPKILERCARHGLVAEETDTTYYLGRQTLLTTGKSRLATWRKKLFAFLSKNSRAPTEFFALPPNRVVELGLQIEL